MNANVELTLEELEALGILTVEEADEEGWDVLLDCAITLLESGNGGAALAYLKALDVRCKQLSDSFLNFYSLLSGFSHIKPSVTQSHVTVNIDNKIMAEIRAAIGADEGDA